MNEVVNEDEACDEERLQFCRHRYLMMAKGD